jgi:hypothetical protein
VNPTAGTTVTYFTARQNSRVVDLPATMDQLTYRIAVNAVILLPALLAISEAGHLVVTIRPPFLRAHGGLTGSSGGRASVCPSRTVASVHQ